MGDYVVDDERPGTRSSLIRLPPRMLVPKTALDDPVDYYYRPLTARLYRTRLELAARLVGAGPYRSLLEVGYGSGIFLPELSLRTRRLAAIDIHDASDRVEKMLKELGVSAELYEGSLFELPFEQGEFDGIVCLSVFEHITDLDSALTELARVVRRGGLVVLGFPVRNVVTDTFFRIAGYNPRRLHPSGHGEIMAAAHANVHLSVSESSWFPRFVPLSLAAYAACRCNVV